MIQDRPTALWKRTGGRRNV